MATFVVSEKLKEGIAVMGSDRVRVSHIESSLQRLSKKVQGNSVASKEDDLAVKYFDFVVTTILNQALSLGFTGTQLEEALQNLNMPLEKIEKLVSFLEAEGEALKGYNVTYGEGMQSVDEVDWRLDYIIKSNVLERTQALEITLALYDANPSYAPLRFNMDMDDVQDFLYKLKDMKQQYLHLKEL